MERLFLPTFLVHCGVSAYGEEELVEAAPECEPAGVAVAFAQEEAAEVAEEVADHGPLSFAERAEHLQPDCRDDSGGGKVGRGGGDRLQLQ